MNKGKIPPQNVEAEMAALGAMLISRKAAQMVTSMLTAEKFYVPAHQVLFATMAALLENGQEVDLVTVKNSLAQQKRLQEVGGVEYVVQVAESVPTAFNASFYAGIVHEKWVRRQVMSFCEDIHQGVWSDATTDQLVEKGYTRFAGVASATSGKSGGWVNKDDVANQMFMVRKSDLKSRFAAVNHATQTGYRRGEVYGCVAGTGGGKSAWLMQEVLGLTVPMSKQSPGKAATEEEINAGGFDVPCGVAFVSLELSAETLTNRAVQHSCGVPDQWRSKEKGDYVERLWLRAYHAFTARNISIYDSSQARGLAWENIEREVKSLALQRPLDVVAIDYLQLLTLSGGSRMTKYEQLASIAERMKLLALQLNVAIIFVSQLTVEREAGDLVDRFKCRGCPDAANPAAGLWAITKPQDAEQARTRRILTIIKSRFGPSGFASELYWDPERLMLTDMGGARA